MNTVTQSPESNNKPFTPSKYQQAIFDWIINGRGDGIVNAVAGAGKTSSLVEGAKLLKTRSATFCAFNKHIAEELSERLEGTGMVAKTLHSIGFAAVQSTYGRCRVDGRKYRNLAKAYVERINLAPALRFEASSALVKLVDLARLNLLDASDTGALLALCDHHGIEPPGPVVLAGVKQLVDEGLDLVQVAQVVDFTDMIYVPVARNLPVSKSDFLFVDECQDLNRCQLELVLAMRAPGGRILFVGDPKQSIMGFAGADAYSYANIKARTNATELPLSICYRCPRSHIALAREIVPQIEPRPDAPDGTIEYISEAKINSLVREGDLVLCRLTAPLVRLCIDLIKTGVAARVRGRDIGRDLTSILRKLEKLPGFDYATLPALLEEYQRQQVINLVQRDADESQIQSVVDRVECLQACYANYPDAQDLDTLCYRIEALFDDNRPSVWLSTVHRAKGLQNERVFLLQPEKLPLRWRNQKDWQLEQERNLRYVALTRATDTLFIAGAAPLNGIAAERIEAVPA